MRSNTPDSDEFLSPALLTHGVVDATAKLEPTRVDEEGNQYGEPGALNESLADIFGSNVEFFANNAADKPDYLIGEKMGLAQKFLRRLDHPSLDRLEGTIDHWAPEAYDAEVHAGSGVSSHAYSPHHRSQPTTTQAAHDNVSHLMVYRTQPSGPNSHRTQPDSVAVKQL